MLDDPALLSLPAETWGVCHVQLGAPPVAGASMTVFWNAERPVGHVLQAAHGGIERKMARQPALLRAPADLPCHTVSIIICTRDRPEHLSRCLGSLPRQSYPIHEIIVVDNGSRDAGTRDLAIAAGVVYLRENRKGLDIARNTGARHAAGEIIAYTDDDVVLHPHWLRNLVAAFDAPEIGAVTGLVLPAELMNKAQVYFESYWSFSQGYDRKDFTPAAFRADLGHVLPAWKIGAGASMAFRRDVFGRVGYFDARLDVGQAGCSGDSEFWYRLIAAGYVCRYEPASVAFHYHRRGMESLGSQLYHYMRGHCMALLVQYQRTGVRANLSMALFWKPRYYAGCLFRSLRRRGLPEHRFLRQEIIGYLAGFLFFLRHPRIDPRD